MAVYSRPRTLMAGLLLSSDLLLTAALTPTRSQSIEKAETPLQVAQLLDCIIQPRFQNDIGVFGLSRVVTMSGHQPIASLYPNTDTEKTLLHRANAANREYILTFLHTTHVPGKAKNPGGKASGAAFTQEFRFAEASCTTLATHVVATNEPPRKTARGKHTNVPLSKIYQETEKIGKVAKNELSALKQGKDREGDCGDWQVVMRPVRALKDSCLKCHQGAKRGDTLGVMVYAVSKTVQKSGTKFL